MNKLKYYVLCSNNIAATKRHLQYIPKDSLITVLNSTDQEYINTAESWCKEQDIEYYITESDGTPATGKNSVMKLFLNSDNDYMVLVDGDDFITPHGVVVYGMISQLDSPPDAVAIVNQFGLVPREDVCDQGCSLRFALDENNPDNVHGKGVRCYKHDERWWMDAIAGRIYRHDKGLYKDISLVHKRLMAYCYKYLNQKETHLRITFYSKKAAIYQFNKDFMVGEDTLQYFDIKNAWVTGNLKIQHLDDSYPSYVYDQRLSGIVGESSKNPELFKTWVTKLVSKLDKMNEDNVFHTDQPPTIKLEFDKEYEPDVLGLVVK